MRNSNPLLIPNKAILRRARLYIKEKSYIKILIAKKQIYDLTSFIPAEKATCIRKKARTILLAMFGSFRRFGIRLNMEND
jgi:hypothetical protein